MWSWWVADGRIALCRGFVIIRARPPVVGRPRARPCQGVQARGPGGGEPTSGSPMSQLELRPGLADVPVAESAVSFIDGKRARLEYRGIAVENLARESCFEETSWLLVKGELPTQRELADFDHQLRHRRRIKYKLNDLIKCLPETGHPMDALQAGVAASGMFYPARDVGNQQNNWESSVRLIAKLPTIVAAFH